MKKIKQNGNAILKAGLGYTIGNYMIKGLTFFSIPIFARLLSPDNYGIYNTYIAYESILCMCVGFIHVKKMQDINMGKIMANLCLPAWYCY